MAKCCKSAFCEHFSDIKKFLLELNNENSTAIKEAKELVSTSSLETNLIYIKSNCGFISLEIKMLETSGTLLLESIKKI